MTSISFAQSFEQKTVSVYFQTDVDQLDGKARAEIRKAIINLNKYIIREIYIEGHTDCDASSIYNESLASRRAHATKDFLLSQGVPAERVKLESFGETQPISEEKALNRRVQLTIVYEIKPHSDDVVRTSVKGEVKVVRITTYHANTKQKLPSTYVVMHKGKNKFANTNINAQCHFERKLYRSLDITFSKDGFLNENIKIAEKDMLVGSDTLDFDVYLRPVEVIQKLRFDHIYFYTDTDDFKPASKPELEKLVKILEEFPDLYVEIQGHMNFSETRKANVFQRIYNHDLSHRRAKAVYDYLISRGIDQKRLTYKGLSNFRMIYPKPKTAEEADKNKRVEVWTLQVVANKH
jgi:outer membrane protein OmpA-like peptidoglycan-associated protein